MYNVYGAVDGDKPGEVAAGFILASMGLPSVDTHLVGPRQFITDIVSHDERLSLDGIDIIDTDGPLPSEIKKRNKLSTSAMGIATIMAKEHGGGFVSCGNTKAMYKISALYGGVVPGIERPCLAVTLPQRNGGYNFFGDAGGMVDCKPFHLAQFAQMLDVYAQAWGVANPRVMLLSNGTEDDKGDELSLGTFSLLQALKAEDRINFCGNVEGTGLFNNTADVTVADGFPGNIGLKSAEGMAYLILGLIRDHLEQHPWQKIPAYFLRSMFRAVAKQVDSRYNGGGLMLGCAIPFVKGHGSSDCRAAQSSFEFLVQVMQQEIVEKVTLAFRPQILI